MRIFEEIWFNVTPALMAAQNAGNKTHDSSQKTVISIIIGVAVVITLGFVTYYVMSKIKRSVAETPPTLSEHLTSFQDAQTEGNMTREEYAQVRDHLSTEITSEAKEGVPLRRPTKK